MMLDTYIRYTEGRATDAEMKEANTQFQNILKNLGLGILLILPFSPITLPYIFSKAKEHNIDLIPSWYKSLSNDDDRLEQIRYNYSIDTFYANSYCQPFN